MQNQQTIAENCAHIKSSFELALFHDHAFFFS